MHLTELETPALVLDQVKMDRNIARMREHLARLGVAFRPHVKTPKAIDVVRRMIATPAGPITVSTLKEAEYFFSYGISDILYAVGVTPNKLEHVARLMRAGARLKIILDNEEMARAVVAHGRETGTRFEVLIEIDCDGHRSGVKPEAPELISIGKLLHEGGAALAGVMTHAGSSYNCTSVEGIRAMAGQERRLAVHCAERLRAAGLPCPVVSIGSSPTATYAQDLSGVTEVRAGVFVFFDLVMAGIEVCKQDDIALSVLTTVIGHQRDRGWIITDAGWMAMSRDRGTAAQKVDQGYGVVCDADGSPIDGLIMAQANQEHGVIAHRSGNPAQTPDLPIGTLLRILPNHACATGAQHDRYHVLENTQSAEVAAVWPRFSGW
ncbi:MAG TPA: DSD1 family PLP-dependent enzyme [Burkholderiales bacterium]|jgi:D-serine deaminase-like pyridoxal phosphate-dependent protein|nr:DSD1 family PLP-dependent enzyme [Burkholderiales bacterium]